MQRNYPSLVIVLLFVIGFIYLINITSPMIIVLSPHFDDGVFSLGGLMAKRDNKLLVATFFTRRPAEVMHAVWDKISGFNDSTEAILVRTQENTNALVPLSAIIKNYDYLDFQYRKEGEDTNLRTSISQDIENLIKAYRTHELFIYGPATFGSIITHPDHQLVHDALMDVWKRNNDTRAHFFIYEDSRYTRLFNEANMGDLNTYLENTEHLKFKEIPIKLSEQELTAKVLAMYKYKSQIKAFVSLGENIDNLTQTFYRERCQTILPFVFACEVVHTISEK